MTHDSSAALNDHLVHLLKEKSFNRPQEKPHPLLHVTVAMAPSSFASIQLLQTPKQLMLDNGEAPSNISLKEIARHSSLIVLYASGIGVDAVLETSSEFQETSHNRSVGGREREGEGEEQRQEREKKTRTKIDSFKVSADVKIPVAQLAVCAVVQEKEGASVSRLPTLSPAQSQLHFQLVNLPPITDSSEVKTTVCVLLEAGVRESSASCVAKIVHSEVSEDTVLTWRDVQGYQLQDINVQATSDDCEEKKNRVVVSASLPLLWSQLVSPNTGIASATTGGIDLLILMEALEAWQGGVEQLIGSAQALVAGKSLREKRILLSLISNAAKLLPITKKVSYRCVCVCRRGGGGKEKVKSELCTNLSLVSSL